jgi:peptidoglycan/LPS O-acetylase OafA/YrhL
MPNDLAGPALAEPTRWRFSVLESSRGILAVIVVVNHLTAATHFYRYVHNGWVAVDFFFVLSGFVIASVYQERIASAGALVRYVVRRVGRLYPLHLFMLAVLLGLEFAKIYTFGPPYFEGETSWPAFWSNLFLFNGFDGNAATWNYPSWSISVEIWANLLAGLLILVCGRRVRIGLIVLIGALMCSATIWMRGARQSG